MKELTKEQKLEVLEECIRKHKVNTYYLCSLIARSAHSAKMINNDEYRCNAHSTVAITLIPEFLRFKPEDKKIGEAWFGGIATGYERRKEVLNELYELIKNN